jgi:two-component system sensor histidine kinase MprB
VTRGPLMLRTRFTFAVAGAVAAVTLVITAVAFIVVRADLQNQVRQELRQQAVAVHRLAHHYHGHIPAGWVPPHSDRFGASSPYTQVVTAHGATWAPAGDLGLLTAGKAAVQVAAGQRGPYYTEATLAGVRAMIFTTPLAPGLAVQLAVPGGCHLLRNGGQAAYRRQPGLAVQLAVPIDTVDTQVASVGATLALLSAIGVALASLVGWGVARAGLAPVGRLAAVAEQVTATGDPGGRVEVERVDELGRLAVSFNKMLRALQRSLAAQRRLAGDASHELRTPLTSLRINVELLAAEPDLPAGERQQVLDRVVAQVTELGQLVANVTELARDESPHQDVNLHEVVAADLEAARRDWPQTPFLADLEPCVIVGSAKRLQIAIRNLLDNAAKFGPPDAPVEVGLFAGELTVRDHGPGIAPNDLPGVFDRFYRAASARGVSGPGLGLAIVRQVAEGHGGTIRAEAPPDGGTLMRFWLPTRPVPAPAAAATMPALVTAAGLEPEYQHHR